MNRYRILVVDDSMFMRKLVSDLIAQHPRLEVAGVARNGKEALDAVRRLRPDAVTMDVVMPKMNGLDAVREIMRTNPVPIVMPSSLTAEGTKETIQALEWGAVDFARKPSGSISLDVYKVKEELHEKLLTAVTAKVRPAVVAAETAGARAAPPLAARSPMPPDDRPKPRNDNRIRQIVAIGTSTGGPRALQQVLSALPADFPAPVLIVQHMPPNFTKSLALRLDQVCAIRVEEAEQGMVLENGKAYVAPGGWHMHADRMGDREHRIALSRQPPRSGHRPSVDVLFESLVPLTELRRLAVLMTGMGSDGAKGMLALKRSGAAATIAQDESTCVVYGMPRAAVESGAADTILPLERIAYHLVNCVTVP